MGHPLITIVLILLLVMGCSSPEPQPSETHASPDTGQATETVVEDTCKTSPFTQPREGSPRVVERPPGPGIDDVEKATYDTFKQAALSDDSVIFVATYDHENDYFLVETATATLRYTRHADASGTPIFSVIEGSIDAIFPNTDATRYPDMEALLAGYSNPANATAPHPEYEGDPRLGFLSHEATSYPMPLARIASLFDAPHAPDIMVGFTPYGRGGTGSHGGLGLLQSRATLILSGPAIRSGVILDDIASLADVAPTVLAAMGASPIGGASAVGEFAEGLYLKTQDGRVLNEALAPPSCTPAQRAVIILLDGVMATELNAHLLTDDSGTELPALRALAQKGAVYRTGAISGFPSFSAPGHMTISTGTDPGTHRIINNIFRDRAQNTNIDFFSFISNPQRMLEDPQAFAKVYESQVNPEVETLAQAFHRVFGLWDPDTATGAYTAVLNEFAIKGADITSFDLVGSNPLIHRAKLALAELADDFALNQVLAIVTDKSLPVPTLLQASFYTTDKAGEGYGPHANRLRQALDEMDGKIAEIQDAYAKRGAAEGTLWVIVSDHGMELQDPKRTQALKAHLAESGIKAQILMGGMVYLNSLRLEGKLAGLTATLTTRDHGSGQPVPDVTLSCDICTPKTSQTDANGQATFTLPAGAVATIGTSHPGYNVQTLTLATPFTE